MTTKTSIAAISAAILLSACGGGGSSTPAAQTTTPATGGTTATADLPTFLNPVTVSGSTINLATFATTYLVKPTGAGLVSVAGNSETVKLDDNAQVGVMQVSGNMNNIIFSKTATVQSLTVTGKMNTIYLPEGSPIVIANAASMISSNTVKYYKP